MKIFPKRVFKYLSINKNTLINLSERQLFFNYPKNLNDPYDCLTPTVFEHVSILDIKKDKNKFSETKTISPKEWKKLYEEEVLESIERYKNQFSEKSGVTCFSENNKTLLMWSHYAENHNGICLEFSTKGDFFHNFKQVDYLDEIPSFDMLKFINCEFTVAELTKLFSIKSKDWCYEKEWRLFITKGSTLRKYPSNNLKAIYFGLRTKKSEIELIKKLNLDVNLYKARLNGKKFEIEFVSI